MSDVSVPVWHPAGPARAIMHIDGDAFFASCEVARDPSLRGKPVVTGSERGIASSMTYEAKRRGIKRGMTMPEIKRVAPETVILPSDYETYSLYSKRMNELIKRYTPMVEEYSIDESFADLTGLRRKYRKSYGGIAEAIKTDLENELGLTFSVGLGPSKVIAKLGSNYNKPSGLTVIGLKDLSVYLKQTPLRKVWGIGPNTTGYLEKFGMRTALDLVLRDKKWVEDKLSKPIQMIRMELAGESVYLVSAKEKSSYQSISKTKTFTPARSDKTYLMAQLTKNIENACIKARRYGLLAREVVFFFKKQSFRHQGIKLSLHHPTATPEVLVDLARGNLDRFYNEKTLYRSSGVILLGLEGDNGTQLDLFGSAVRVKEVEELYHFLDRINQKYGKHSVHLATSLKAMVLPNHQNSRSMASNRKNKEGMFQGETSRKRVAVPFLGFVR